MKTCTLISLIPAVLGCSSIAAGGDNAASTATFEVPQAAATTLEAVVSQAPTGIVDEETSTPVSEKPTLATDGGSCGAASVDELVGYGDGTTGGGDVEAVTVTSCSELEAAASAGGVVNVDGNLSGCGVIKVASDTSIIGVGAESGEFVPTRFTKAKYD